MWRRAPFEKSEFPSSHHREEGWRRHQENGAKPPFMDAAGVVFLGPTIGTPPRPRGDARRGITPFHFVHTFFDWSLEPQGEHWVDLGGASGGYPASNDRGQRNNGHSDKNVQCMSA